MAYIEFDRVCKLYPPATRALDNMSFTVEKGELCVIVGHSGAGKTTLLNILGGMDTATSGHVRLDGREITGLGGRALTEYRRNDVGFVFQFYNLVQNLTARENVELPLAYRGMPKAQRHVLSEDALKRVGLEKRMNHLPKQMSGGQQQRVAIARAVAAKPPIILADEPTGNLDSHSGAEVMRILHELHREGRTVILITHDNEIAANAHRVIRIQDGQVVEDYINADK